MEGPWGEGEGAARQDPGVEGRGLGFSGQWVQMRRKGAPIPELWPRTPLQASLETC